MNEKIPTPIVDKNGKMTTVHKNVAAPVPGGRALPNQPIAAPSSLGAKDVTYIKNIHAEISSDWLEENRVKHSAYNRDWFKTEGELYPNGHTTALYDNGGIFWVTRNDEYVFAALVDGQDIAGVSVNPVVQPRDEGGYNIAYVPTDEGVDTENDFSGTENRVIVFSVDANGDRDDTDARVIHFADNNAASDYVLQLAENKVDV